MRLVTAGKHCIRKVFNHFGYDIFSLYSLSDDDMESGFKEICEKCTPYTMTSTQRMYALYKAVHYIIDSNIPGDFVECGVWKGGSSMLIAFTLLEMGVTDRKILLYDTFSGMTEPTDDDICTIEPISSMENWKKNQKDGYNMWAYASIEEVEGNMVGTGYPKANLSLIKGRVEDTIPDNAPDRISLLRLDTDWFGSTYQEMVHLFPRISKNGVLIVDDYGYWAGCRKAVDEYIGEHNIHILFNRIDNCGRIGIKTEYIGLEYGNEIKSD